MLIKFCMVVQVIYNCKLQMPEAFYKIDAGIAAMKREVFSANEIRRLPVAFRVCQPVWCWPCCHC